MYTFLRSVARVGALIGTIGCWGCVSPPRVDASVTALHSEARPVHLAARHTAQSEGAASMLQSHLAFVESKLSTPLHEGNRATLLIDGPQTHAAMFAAIDAARDHINFETYILDVDAVGERLAQALIAKQAQGVKVNVIYDSIGALNVPREYFSRLRHAGIALCEFNPVNPLRARIPWRLNHRDHRKLMVVDGQLAFTGGIHLTRHFASSALSSGRRHQSAASAWRDTHVALEGPVVSEFQRAFIYTWYKQRCEDLRPALYMPPLEKKGTDVARMIMQDPDTQTADVYVALHSAISHAQQRVYLTYGYFVPDAATIQVLTATARRGVQVCLLLPGYSDFWAPFRAGRSRYGELFAAGVRIFEYRDVFLHAKTAVIDGRWSTVGSANLDWRSFVHNEELNVAVLGTDFGRQLETLFERDVAQAHEVTWLEWQQRPADERVKEWIARRFEYWL